jgi:hypothetical protein
MSSSEPEWMKSIPSDFVCNYFWAISFVVLLAGLVTVAGLIYSSVLFTKIRGTLILLAIQALLTYGLIFFLYVCLYLTCSRSLLDNNK